MNVSGGDFTGITSLYNIGTVSVSAGRTLSAGSISTASGSTVTNLGTITTTGGFGVVEGATLNSTSAASILNTDIQNQGTTNARGQINGTIGNTGVGVFTVTGALTATGSFSNSADAQLKVTGGDLTVGALSNTGSGNITISAGRTLSATGINNNQGAIINNSGTLISTGGFANNGTLNSNAATSVVNGGLDNGFHGTVNARNQINGAISNSTSSSLFTVVGDLAVNSSFSNSGQLVVSGGDLSGVTSLTNDFGGTVSVSAGRTLTALAGVTNGFGATVTGAGTIAGNFVNQSGSSFAAGDGTAGSSMNVTGSLAMQSGALYMVQINPTTSSFANVTGAATLNSGATVQASFTAGAYVAKKYTILHSTAGVTGRFNDVVTNSNLPSGFKTTISYGANDVYLDLALAFIPPPGSGLTGNQQGVGNALIGFFNSTGSIPLVFGGLTAAGLTQISGETASGSQATSFGAMNQFMGIMTDQFAAGRDGGANAPALCRGGCCGERLCVSRQAALAETSARPMPPMYSKAPLARNYDPRWSVWGAGFGGSQTTNGSTAAGTNTSTSRIFGVAAGADYIFSPNTVAGFALAGGGTNFSVAGGGGGRSDLFQAGAFIAPHDRRRPTSPARSPMAGRMSPPIAP